MPGEIDEEMVVAQLASLIQIDMPDARKALEWANWDQELAIEVAFAQIENSPAPSFEENNSEASCVSATSKVQAAQTPAASPTAAEPETEDPVWSAVESPTQTLPAVASAVEADESSEAEAFRSEGSDEQRPRRGVFARLWYGNGDDARSQVQEPPAVERLAAGSSASDVTIKEAAPDSARSTEYTKSSSREETDDGFTFIEDLPGYSGTESQAEANELS